MWPETLPVRQIRIARPTDRLDEVARFYRDGLGLPELDRFAGHAGYSGVILGLPGPDHHLEFTHYEHGSPCPAPTRDNLLVLYLDGPADVERTGAGLAALGYPPVDAENPFWTAHGAVTIEDPDGWRVVLMPRASFQDDAGHGENVTIDWYTGDRLALRPLFELAEDSAAELDSYLMAGRVLVASSGGEVVGHLQLVDDGRTGHAEIKNMAVREDRQGRGIGHRLVGEALVRLAAENVSTVQVATASADVGNLRFYQRQGFRMRSIERDAFTASTGYPPGTRIDGIPLRDRVWLDLRLATPVEKTR
jgi:ribosomal protein S18 acetylase RimI-like enzyme